MDKWNMKWLKIASYMLLGFSVMFYASGQIVSAVCLIFSSVMLFASTQLVEMDRLRKSKAGGKV